MKRTASPRKRPQGDVGGTGREAILVTATDDPRQVFTNNPIRDTYRLSFMANNLVLPVYDAIKRGYGLNRGEYLLLFCLAQVPRLTAQQVAWLTGRPRNSISRAVHRMLDEGYLERVPDPGDGRQAILTLTDRGRRLNEEILPLFEARERQLLAPLSDRERDTLDRLLGKLVRHTAALAG